MAEKSFSVTEADAYLIARALEVKIAQVKRAINAADDSDIKSAMTKQMVAYVDLQRKFPPL